MQRFAPVVLIALIFVLAGLLDAAPVHAVEKNVVEKRTIEVPARPLKAGRAMEPVPGGPSDKSALWWNDPGVVEALKLTDEQREKMGEYLKAYRKAVPEDRRPAEFHEALVQGDWKKARIESEKITKLAETAVRKRGALKIDVLSLLSEEQLGILVDRHPQLVYKPWRRAMSEAPPR